ncbi:hypothetical protein [Laspinema palackyanum]|uniref:hypothetical protein n=1 Tax=Laspinema palackyanum TaxID=3231601 RepID=UPI00345CE0B2|nr:hypothetical protein [Laspinema sp. D2c]
MTSNLTVHKFLRFLWVGVVSSLPVVATAVHAETSPQYEFTVTNNTGSPITELYVDDTEQADWGDSILGDSPIDPGETAPFYWADEDWVEGDPCLYDVFTRSEDGTEGFAEAVDFCKNPAITVSPK